MQVVALSNTEMVQQEEETAAQHQVDIELEERQRTPIITGLAGHVRTCWEAARQAKMPIEQLMLTSLRQRNGSYDQRKLSDIENHGGSDIFMRVTQVKCRAAESWLRDILLDTGTPPWGLEPTPIPELSPEHKAEIEEAFAATIIERLKTSTIAPTPEEMRDMQEMALQDFRYRLLQESENRASRMELKIKDQFAEGGWAEAFNDFITDLVTYPCAFIKGPIVRRRRKLGWVTNEEGKTEVEVEEVIAPEFERVDPFRIYPEPGITHIKEGYLFQHHPLSRPDLSDLIGVPGYDDDAIKKILELGAGESWIYETVETQKEDEERKFSTENRPTDIYDALEFWGKVSGNMLLEWGVDKKDIDDKSREYDANIWLVGNYVIKAVLNYDPLGEKPYSKTSFIKRPGSFWGEGIPEVIADLQTICNASARALVNNMGIASGPQVDVNIERLAPGEDLTDIHPWKVWQTTNDPLGGTTPAVRFTNVEDNATTLMAVYDKFAQLADDHSGIPAYIHGDLNTHGAGRTASGLSMLMGSAGKGIRQVVMHIDADVIKLIVYRQFIYNMRYDEDESIKGDVEIRAKGSVNLAVKETVNVRRVEFLQATANDYDHAIIGNEGRAAILREVAKGLHLPVDDVIPSREKEGYLGKIEAQAQSEASQGQQQGSPTPTQPDGSPKGGQEGNLVSNKNTGIAG